MTTYSIIVTAVLAMSIFYNIWVSCRARELSYRLYDAEDNIELGDIPWGRTYEKEEK